MERSKILIVDDEPDIIRALSLRLRNAGYDVVQASDGATATLLAVRESPDLILLDIGMPAGNGHTVLARLRKNIRTMTVPVIYLTARASEEDRKTALDAGAAGYLVKPYDSNELLAAVREALTRPEGSPAG
jgi:two-component system KDP operon response regulator KdpE